MILRRILTPVVLLLAAIIVSGCSSVVFEPERPVEPVAVYVLSEGIHTGLVMPSDADSCFVEFAYGEWGWYAEEQTGVFDAVSAALWETQGTLGRRTIPVTPRPESAQPERDAANALIAWMRKRGLHVRLSPVWVPRARVQKLVERLNAAWQAAKENGPSHESRCFTFVKDPHGYWLGFNCSDITADWLRELGCEVTPALFRTSLSVAGQPRDISTDDREE